MAELVLLPEAMEDYRAAYAWYHKRGEHLSAAFEAEVDHALERVGAAPGRFAKYDDRHRFFLLRRFPFSLVYRVEDDRVLVVAVAHAKRKPRYWEGRSD